MSPMLPGYCVRRAIASDLGALARLEAHFPTDRLGLRHLTHLLARAHADVFVVEFGGTPVADVVILYRRRSRCARIYSLVVDPAHRGCGLAEALLRTAETAAHRRGCERVALEVRPDNAAALRLYASHDYGIAGTKTGFYEDGSEALRLGKLLASAPA